MLKVNKGHIRYDMPAAAVVEAPKGLPKIKREKVVIAQDQRASVSLSQDMPVTLVIDAQMGLTKVKRESVVMAQDEEVEIILTIIFTFIF